MALVQTLALTRSYRVGKVDIPALNGTDIAVQAGEFVAIMGPSGCGKTTFLHLVGALDQASSGQVLIDGVDLARLRSAGRTRLRRDKIGFVFQRFNLMPTLTGLANLELAAKIKGLSASTEELMRLLDLVGVAKKARSTPLEMSIGEQQRVAIARALVGSPRLLLADEPTGSLDSESSARVLELFRHVNTELKQTLIMVTHSAEAAGYAHRTIRMRDGRVVPEAGSAGGIA